jgi:hypothetical protein
MIDQFPVHWSNHVDGLLANHWVKNKVSGCTLEDEEELSQHVSDLWLYYYRFKLLKYT